MAKTNLYTVDVSKYKIDITKIEKIEDAGDDFVTREELMELLGGDSERFYYGYPKRAWRYSVISSEVAAWKSKIKDGSKSIIITDDDDRRAATKLLFGVGLRPRNSTPWQQAVHPC